MTLLNFSSTARGLITLYTSTLLAGMWAMILPAVPVLAHYFGISTGTAAQTVTALAVGRFVGLPVSGAVLDRLGTRSALTAGPALACVAGLLAASMPWFGLILALLFLLGIADSVWVIAREVAGIDLARPDQRGRVLSGFHGVNNLGLALGPLFGGFITEGFGFRAVFIVYAACAAISVLIGFSVENSRPAYVQSTSHSEKGWKPRDLVERVRSLKDLFHQIQPDLRATYA